MNHYRQLFAYFFVLCVAAFATYSMSKHFSRKLQSHKNMSLEWMRSEYEMDDDAFSQAKILHQAYSEKVQAMSSELGKVDRILLEPPRRVKLSNETKRSVLQLDEALCIRYEDLTIKHLQEVSSLMSPKQAERFLNDFTTLVQQQRIEHQRALLARASQ